MDADFWLQRWAAGQIGFHGETVHTQLAAHWPALGLASGARVFAPLCGKSLDLVWLRERGHAVVGIELSPLAIEAFFSERGLSPVVDRHGPCTRYRADGYELLCGDVFALDRTLLGTIDAIYDRAALIALPPAMRTAYAGTLTGLAGNGTRMLLITVQYAPDAITPPPFAIADDEITAHYASAWAIERLAEVAAAVKDQTGSETVFRLTRT